MDEFNVINNILAYIIPYNQKVKKKKHKKPMTYIKSPQINVTITR